MVDWDYEQDEEGVTIKLEDGTKIKIWCDIFNRYHVEVEYGGNTT